MSDYLPKLPKEVVVKVCSRLNAKSLIRCSAVSKNWYTLITSTEFISSHLNVTRSLPDKSHLLIEYKYNGYTNKRDYVVYSDDKSGSFEKYASFTINPLSDSFKLVGSCNGLICLDSHKIGSISSAVLWNPMIRRALRLPESDYMVEDDYFMFSSIFGFIFDPIGNDYKVLRIHTNVLRIHSNSGTAPSHIVELFRLSTGSWEDITHKAAPLSNIFCAQVVLKGVYHWIGEYSFPNCQIITFDAHQESFGRIELPLGMVKNDGRKKSLFVFEESLFLIRSVGTRDANEQHTYNFDVWKMEEYSVVQSWSRVHTMDFDMHVTPLGIRTNGEMLWTTEGRVWMTKGRVFSTSLVDGCHNDLASCQNAFSNNSCIYGESLILLDKSLSTAAGDSKLEILPEHQCF